MTPNDDLVRRIERDLLDSYDEELELEIEDRNPEAATQALGAGQTAFEKSERMAYFRELFRLQAELVKLQDWIAATKQKVVIPTFVVQQKRRF